VPDQGLTEEKIAAAMAKADARVSGLSPLSAKQLLVTQACMHHRFGAGEHEAMRRLRVPVIGGA
jgi:hypothetical protein